MWVKHCSVSRAWPWNTFASCPSGAERGLSPCCRQQPWLGELAALPWAAGGKTPRTWQEAKLVMRAFKLRQGGENQQTGHWEESSGKSKCHGWQWRSRGRKLNAYIHYASLQKFGTKCFFERSCSSADTWLIVQNLGKSIQGLTWNFGLQFVFLGMGKLMRHGFFFSIAYNEFHLLDILEFTLFICK